MSKALRVVVLLRRLRTDAEGQVAVDLLGPCERAALAAALDLARVNKAHVTAVAMGPAKRENPLLTMALAAGCDRAVRIDDEGCDDVDYWGVARMLSAFVRNDGFDLVLCGSSSQDQQQGAVGAAVAEQLAIPHASAACGLTVADGKATLTSAPGDARGDQQVVLPALITVAHFGGSGTESTANFDGSAAAQQPGQSVDELGPDDIGVHPRELRNRRALAGSTQPVPVPQQPVLVKSAEELVARLRADHLIPS